MSSRKAAVVGSGFGGLALAVRLQAAGIQTTLVEKRDKPGGRAYVYEDGDFKFDGGPTVRIEWEKYTDIVTIFNEADVDYYSAGFVYQFTKK